jgi:putative transposase
MTPLVRIDFPAHLTLPPPLVHPKGELNIALTPMLPRQHGVSEPTVYGWRRKYGGMEQAEVRRLRELEKENVRLKRLLAERDLELDAVKEFLKKQ